MVQEMKDNVGYVKIKGKGANMVSVSRLNEVLDQLLRDTYVDSDYEEGVEFAVARIRNELALEEEE